MPGSRGFDGTIKIDSSIDSKGFNKGVSGMTKMLKPLAAAIAALFVTLIGVKAVSAVAKLSAEFQRMAIAAQAVGQLHGFTAEKTRELTSAIVDAGIQTDVANRAFLNFSREGLDVALLPALAKGAQDLNVFSAAGETSSDVLDRLLLGVLNLNSLMLRRAGVAIDVLTAEKAYGEQIGKTTAQMTIQEKRQGVLIAVTEKLKGVQGLYELSQKTLAGQLSSNTRIMNEFKAALGGPLQNALFLLVKGFNSLVKAITRAISVGGQWHATFVRIGAVATLVARIIARLFAGLTALFGGAAPKKATVEGAEQLADGVSAAADAEQELATGIDEAAKAAKGALASFDELNVLQQPDEGAGTGAGEDKSGLEGGLGEINVDEITNPMDEIIAKADEMAEQFKTAFAPFFEALEGLRVALEPLGLVIWEGLKWAWDNIIVPLGQWVVNEALPVFLDLLAVEVELFTTMLKALAPLWDWFWEFVLKPAAEWTGRALLDGIVWLTENLKELNIWIQNNEEAFRAIVVVLGIALAVFFVVTGAISGIVALIIGAIIVLANWRKAWEIYASVTGQILETLGHLWRIYVTRLKETWTGAVDFIKSAFVNTFNFVYTFVKGIINRIIDLINLMVSGIVLGINAIIGAANAVGGILPGSPSLSFVTAPRIPRLATGAVIPPNAAFAAILGDQKSGTNIEAPENLIRQIIQEEIGNIEADITIKFEGTMSELVRNLKPLIDRENIRIGGSSIVSGVTV